MIGLAPVNESRHTPNPAPSVAPGALSLELRHDLGLQPGDASALEALVAGRPNAGVFLSPAWLSGFFSDPCIRGEPAIVLMRESGVLRAVAPLLVRQTLTHVHVGILGGGLGSDRVDLLAARGFEAAASDTFLANMAEFCGRRSFVLDLRDVPSESPLWGAIHRAGIERSPALVLQPREIHTLPYLDLTESRSSFHHARSLDKHRRWLERRGRLKIELLRHVDDVMPAFESLRRFLHARWLDQGTGSVLDQPRAVRFHQRVLPRLLADGLLRMIRLSIDARTIAVFYGLACGHWWGYYLAGYDRPWAERIHLGQITLASAIELAADEGAVEFDFLKGADRIKYLWPVRERTTLDADAYSDASGAQLTRATRASRDAAVALAKSAHAIL